MSFQTALANPNEPRVSSLAAMIVKVIAAYDYGRMIDYAEFRRIIFENPQATRGRAAILQAKRRLLLEHHKLLVNVRQKGYQIVQPNEHVGESKRLETHGRRRYRRSLDIIVHAEEEKLTPQERQQHQEQGLRLRLLLALSKNIARAAIQSTSETTTVAIPTGRQLARLLASKPPEEKTDG
jgi:hypothetical protein